jgi:hypothetical protein
MTDKYTFAINLMDESFNPYDTRNYGLAIIMSETSIGFCTLDFKRNKFLGLHRCVRNEVPPQEGRESQIPSFREFLDGVCTTIPWLKNSFKQVKIAYHGKNSTLVPALLFDPEAREQYLKFNFTPNQDDLILSDHLMPLDAYQVFTVPERMMEAAKHIFPKSKIVHFSSLLIESVWISYKNRINSPHVFLHLREQLVDIMIFDGRQMNYFNTFTFQSPEDVVYYLIFVMEQLNFNPEMIPLVLLGDVATGEGLSELLLRYVRHIETGRRNESYRYSYILNQVPSHTLFPLLNFFSCGL